jgi:hypothetical protein
MADNFSFIGTFAYDTDVEIFHFTLANPTAGVALRTWSYAGGVDADGNTIPAGGFQPILDVYMADGTQMNPGVAGPCTVPTTGNALSDLLPDPATGECSGRLLPNNPILLGRSLGAWRLHRGAHGRCQPRHRQSLGRIFRICRPRITGPQ